mmetsp:Transcript_924/g.2626  ORF Transcript_924/g.2626 Transcript_924/m.2626 type:complete len:333 (+) Transcript_924:188-1186(+)
MPNSATTTLGCTRKCFPTRTTLTVGLFSHKDQPYPAEAHTFYPPVVALTMLCPASLSKLFFRVSALPALLPVVPKTFVLSAIWPSEDSESVLLVAEIVAAVVPPSWPRVNPETVDHRIFPLTLEATAVARKVDARTINDVLRPLAVVNRAIHPAITPTPFLLATSKKTLIPGTLYPLLNTVAVLEVAAPLARVRHVSIVIVNPEPTGNVALPLSNVYVAVAVSEASVACSNIVVPLAIVLGAIWPCLQAVAVSRTALPLTDVRGTALKNIGDTLLGSSMFFGHASQLFQLPVKISRVVPVNTVSRTPRLVFTQERSWATFGESALCNNSSIS